MSKFSDDAIRAVVAKARYSEPGAADHIIKTLIQRRDKVLRAWLTGVNPLVNARLSSDGELTFENAAVDAGIAKPPTEYRFTLSRFDNATGVATALIEGGITAGTSGRVEGSPRLKVATPTGLNSAFVQVAVRTIHPDHPGWSTPSPSPSAATARSGRPSVSTESASPSSKSKALVTGSILPASGYDRCGDNLRTFS